MKCRFLIALLFSLAVLPVPTRSQAQVMPFSAFSVVQQTGAVCPFGSQLVSKSVSAAFTGSGDIKLVTGASQKATRLYRAVLLVPNSATALGFTEGTGTNCATVKTTLSGSFVQTSAANQAVDLNLLAAPLIANTAADDLCLNQSTANTTTVTGFIQYCQE